MTVARGTPITVALTLLLLLPLHVGQGGLAAEISTVGGSGSLAWSGGYSIIQHPLPSPNSQPWSITTDRTGRVWFVEQGTNELGELDPATGIIRQYPIPTPQSTPDSVAADSGGNVWFTELTANKLGELPAGGRNVTEFPIPGETVELAGSSQTLGCGPGAVLPDKSGNVWVACLFSNEIEEFSPVTGHFDRFELPVFQSAPAGMAFDGRGNLWFTAADADMLGRASLSQLKNNTSDGITEFAPLNQTYLYTFTHPTSFLGTTTTITSSLPTPSGIAFDPSGRLWVTEHVDSSFDSYNPSTQSLVKYWTSQTFNASGFAVSFPNGIAVDSNGTVWIGEHYGNKIAELLPAMGQMVEIPAPCCNSSIAGVYSIALGADGGLWFVEISGNAIGEVVPTRGPFRLTLALPQRSLEVAPDGSLTVPMRYGLAAGTEGPTSLSLSASGISGTGSLQNSSATFAPSSFSLSPGGAVDANLTLALHGLRPGTYYITLSATSTPGGIIYSSTLQLTVAGSPSYPIVLLPVAGAAAAVLGVLGWTLARRSGRRTARRRLLGERYSLQSAKMTAAPETTTTR